MGVKYGETGSSGLMKSMNKTIVLEAILNSEPVSRTALSEMAGLAMPTVMRIVEGFIADGLVEEIGKGDSSGGRKPVLLRINPDRYYFLGTDVSRECHSVLTNLRGEILEKAQCSVDYDADEAVVAAQISANMRRVVEKSGLDREKIMYSGVGTPGIGFKFFRNSNQAFEFWSAADRVRLEELLQLGYPTVFENVGRLGAVAELKFGIGKRLRDFLYIYADEGIGMGVVLGGKLATGHSGIAGEFGHTTINAMGQQCYCGNRGCVETYCSSRALIREYETNLLNDGLLQCAKNQTPLFDLLCAVESGNPHAVTAVENAGRMLGVGISNVINLYNPEAIIMGGELCATLPGYMQCAQEEAGKHIFMNEAKNVTFYEATIDRNSEAVGAAGLAMERFFDEYCKR